MKGRHLSFIFPQTTAFFLVAVSQKKCHVLYEYIGERLNSDKKQLVVEVFKRPPRPSNGRDVIDHAQGLRFSPKSSSMLQCE